MVNDDRADYPMSFFIKIVLDGNLDQQCFQESISQALQRHPLLLVRMTTKRFLKHWELSSSIPELQWMDSVEAPAGRDRFINLRKESGLRMWGESDENQATILFQFHHALTDGVGAIQFIGDILAFYGQKTAGSEQEKPELLDVDYEALRIRGQLWEPGHEHETLYRSVYRHLTEMLPVMPEELKSGSLSVSQPNSEKVSPFVSRIIEGKMLRSLKKVATKNNVTPNELYCGSLFQTLVKWNKRYGDVSEKQSFRVGMPFTLRTAAHQSIPAANVLSYVFITQKVHEIANTDELLKIIHVLHNEAFELGDRSIMAWLMGLLQRIPGGFTALANAPYRFSTAMLANVADVKRQLRNRFPLHKGQCVAGNVELVSLQGAAPVRPGTHLGLSLGTYAGRLFMNLNCSPQKFSVAQANEMADMFVDNLLEFVEEPASRKLEVAPPNIVNVA